MFKIINLHMCQKEQILTTFEISKQLRQNCTKYYRLMLEKTEKLLSCKIIKMDLRPFDPPVTRYAVNFGI